MKWRANTLYKLQKQLEKQTSFSRIHSFIQFLVGSSMIVVGGTVGLIYSFNGFFIPVFAGFTSFVAGYRICQFSISSKKINELSESLKIQKIFSSREIVNLGLFAMGGIIFSRGFVELGTAVQLLSIETGLTAGALIIAGYIPAHLSVNDSVI